MKLEKLHIRNFKSLVDVEIDQPNPFTVFVGPNGSGKSNIFEALEFLNYCYRVGVSEAFDLFNGLELLHIGNRTNVTDLQFEKKTDHRNSSVVSEPPGDSEVSISIKGELKNYYTFINLRPLTLSGRVEDSTTKADDPEQKFFIESFSRLFIGKENLRKKNTFTSAALNIDASNLENVLKRVLADEDNKSLLIENLQTLIPEFENIEIQSSPLSGKNELAVYEKTFRQPLTKNLISDGTYNILSLLTALYQSDEPQFLCIEEPENGLHPFAIKQLVKLFRQQCEEKGHYIWLNTHSQTLVSELKPEEIITVNKENGATKIKQHKGQNLYSLTMDEAWLSNALGGGMPW